MVGCSYRVLTTDRPAPITIHTSCVAGPGQVTLEIGKFFLQETSRMRITLINPRSRTEHQAAKPTAFWKLTREIKIKNEIQTRVDGINKGSGETDELRGGGNPEN